MTKSCPFKAKQIDLSNIETVSLPAGKALNYEEASSLAREEANRRFEEFGSGGCDFGCAV